MDVKIRKPENQVLNEVIIRLKPLEDEILVKVDELCLWLDKLKS